MTEPHLYHTTDLALSAYLRCKNLKISRVERNGGKKATLIFDAADHDVQQLVKSFYDDDLVGAKTFADNMRDVKGFIFNY